MSTYLGKSKSFCFCCYYKFLASDMHSHYCNDLIQSINVLSAFVFQLAFILAFICRNTTGSLVNNLFGVKIFNHFPSFTSSSSP